MIPCVFCDEKIDPRDTTAWQRVVGFQRRGQGASRRGGSDITLRETRQEFAHDKCVRRRKRGVGGMSELF